ncbi:hypothetical protein CEXT_750331 [Caerostris extrusa]|uniref:Uncharacterized protein n=1 Tax=Caerostris extrusa TaxID=172846 RepID=A0AAV4XL86_CAEEX|nr:hypothetical protein CEXT_750331 [Caerostris extrusa]
MTPKQEKLEANHGIVLPRFQVDGVILLLMNSRKSVMKSSSNTIKAGFHDPNRSTKHDVCPFRKTHPLTNDEVY